MSELGEFECDLEGRFSAIRTQETNLGNFICDIMVIFWKISTYFPDILKTELLCQIFEVTLVDMSYKFKKNAHV